VRLLDTDVMVDLMRDYAPAVAWLDSLHDTAPRIPGFVVMELVIGCRNRREMIDLQGRLKDFEICWPTERDCNRAWADFPDAFLGHGLGVIDALIAATAVGRRATLCTFNVRHFSAVRGLSTEQPYQR
jgi:predicted nucleic acid-binding protein